MCAVPCRSGLSPHTCWPTQPFPTAHGHPPCRLSTLATHKLTHSRPPSPPKPDYLGHTQIQPTRPPSPHTNSTHPSTFPAHKFNPPDYLPRTQIEHLPPHKLNIFPHKNATHTTTLATQIRPPSPTKIDHIPHTKIDTPDHLSHTNSSTSPHKFEHLPRKKSTQLRAPSLTKN